MTIYICYQWTVRNFFLYGVNRRTEFVNSPFFSPPGNEHELRFYLRLFTRGALGDDRHLSLYLYFESSCIESIQSAFFFCSIMTGHGQIFSSRERFGRIHSGHFYGWVRFFPRLLVYEYNEQILPRGRIIIKFEMYFNTDLIRWRRAIETTEHEERDIPQETESNHQVISGDSNATMLNSQLESLITDTN